MRPLIVHCVALAALAVQVWPPRAASVESAAVAVKPVIVAPPLSIGALQVTVALASPAFADPIVGAPGRRTTPAPVNETLAAPLPSLPVMLQLLLKAPGALGENLTDSWTEE